jgi:hypothetical protein
MLQDKELIENLEHSSSFFDKLRIYITASKDTDLKEKLEKVITE